MKQVEELLNRYFEGETSIEEERWLKGYFRSTPTLPPHLEPYRSLFGYFESESLVTSSHVSSGSAWLGNRKFWLLAASSVAAACLLFFFDPYASFNGKGNSSQGEVVTIVKQPQVPVKVNMTPIPESSISASTAKPVRKSLPDKAAKPSSGKEQKGKGGAPKKARSKALEPIENVNGVDESLKKLEVIKGMNSSLSSLSSLAYLQDYCPKDK